MKISHNAQLPGHPGRDKLVRSLHVQDFRPSLSFPVTSDSRKIELYTLVPPSTQRGIIEHYIEVVATQFTLLSTEHESRLKSMENPLKWVGSNKNDPFTYTLLIVFAISTTLIARDIDPNLASIASRTRFEIQRLSINDHDTNIEKELACTILCTLALCEMITPTTGQFWDLLGRAASIMQDWQEASLFPTPDLNEDRRRLERVLLKLERYINHIVILGG